MPAPRLPTRCQWSQRAARRRGASSGSVGTSGRLRSHRLHQMVVITAITKADPPVLKSEETTRLQRLDRSIRKVVEIAVAMFSNGEFSPDITLHVFRRAMQDATFVADYTAHIGGADPYVHGNPLKDVNRELRWRIKNAMPVEVVTDKEGKPVERRNLKGEVIQSYTLLKLRGEP